MPKASRSPQNPVEVVDPRWLLKAGALAFLATLTLAYVTLCVLFWQGEWQLVLAPTATVAATPASLSLNFEPVTFGDSHLTGWFLPSDSPSASSSAPTVLFLHSGTGNIADALPSAQSLHAARLNVLLFDYRGFGASPGPHPTQARMEEDAATALDYLTHTRGLALSSIIPYGEGIGASLATRLATQHPEFPALMLIYPQGDMAAAVKQDPRARLAPVFLLFHEAFPLAKPLATLTTPKLILQSDTAPHRLDIRPIADPKLTVELRTKTDATAEPLRSINRFLDTYVPRAPQQLR